MTMKSRTSSAPDLVLLYAILFVACDFLDPTELELEGFLTREAARSGFFEKAYVS
jgi:hypothetical protein